MFGSHYTYWFWHLYSAVLDRLLLIFVFFNNLVHCLHPIRFLIVFPQSSFHFQPYVHRDAKVHTGHYYFVEKGIITSFLVWDVIQCLSILEFTHLYYFLLLESTILFIYYLLSSLGSHYSIIFCSIISIKQFQGGWGFFSPIYFLSSLLKDCLYF